MQSVYIRNGVETIGLYAFGNCTALTEITLPDSVKTIGMSAFGGCNTLASINLPKGLESIGVSAFSSCKKLKTVYYRGSETDRAALTIGNYNEYLQNATWKYNVNFV